jgi:hypothetical protein
VIETFQLAAVIKQPHKPQIFHIPLHQTLQTDLADTWASQYEHFTRDKTLIPFTAGYTPEESDVFYLDDYQLPEWCRTLASATVHRLDALPNDTNTLEQIIGILGFGRWHNEELMLIQSFSRSHIIQPTRTLLFDKNVYQTPKNPGLHLSDRLTATYTPANSRLVFGNFRSDQPHLATGGVLQRGIRATDTGYFESSAFCGRGICRHIPKRAVNGSANASLCYAIQRYWTLIPSSKSLPSPVIMMCISRFRTAKLCFLGTKVRLKNFYSISMRKSFVGRLPTTSTRQTRNGQQISVDPVGTYQ